jgi:ABC-2 type transport system permease protein
MTALPSAARQAAGRQFGARRSAAWVASDYWEMAKRSLRHIRHDPEQLVNVTLQPVLIVVLMHFLFGGAINTGTHGSYINFVMPGIFVVAAAFAAVTTTISVASDMLDGVIDRFRTLPMAKSAVIAGHVIADLVRSLVGVAVTIAVGYAVGFRPSAGLSGWGTAIAVILLVTLVLSVLAALIGLLGKSVEVAQQLAAIIIIPVFFSDALVPAGTMPPWLRVVTANQPITQAIDTIRALLLDQPVGDHLWLTLAELGGIIIVVFAFGTVLFRRTASS